MKRIRWETLPRATAALVGLNVLIFLYLTIAGSSQDSWFMIENGALYVPAVLQGHEWYRLITAMFLHFGFRHLFFNMLLLYFVGDILERILGPVTFLFLYFVTGVCGNAASLLYYAAGQAYVVSAGASGAIFGLVGAVAYMVYVNRGYFRGISLHQIILMIVFSLYSGLTGSGVNNVAHIVGLVTGVLCGIVFYRGEP